MKRNYHQLRTSEFLVDTVPLLVIWIDLVLDGIVLRPVHS